MGQCPFKHVIRRAKPLIEGEGINGDQLYLIGVVAQYFLVVEQSNIPIMKQCHLPLNEPNEPIKIVLNDIKTIIVWQQDELHPLYLPPDICGDIVRTLRLSAAYFYESLVKKEIV